MQAKLLFFLCFQLAYFQALKVLFTCNYFNRFGEGQVEYDEDDDRQQEINETIAIIASPSPTTSSAAVK